MKRRVRFLPALALLLLLIVPAVSLPALAGGESTVSGETCTIGYYGYIDTNGGLWLWGENSAGRPDRTRVSQRSKPPRK